MSDIVERLRARKLFWLNGGAWMMGVDPDPDCAEAADEIERLRASLEKGGPTDPPHGAPAQEK